MTDLPVDPVAAAVADLAWLTGHWRGHRGEDRIEEAWGEPVAGTMMGMFRWIRGEAPFFYELTVLEPRDEGVVLRIKHFHPGLVAWEEKDRCVTFGLVALDGHDAVFRQEGVEDPPWSVYRRRGDDLESYFERAGEIVRPEDVFHFTRVVA